MPNSWKSYVMAPLWSMRRSQLKNFNMDALVSLIDNIGIEGSKQCAMMPPTEHPFKQTFSLGGYVCHGVYLGYQNKTNVAILNPHDVPIPSTKFWFNSSYGKGDVICRVSKFLRYLAILNHQIPCLPPIKIWFKLIYGSGRDGCHADPLRY